MKPPPLLNSTIYDDKIPIDAADDLLISVVTLFSTILYSHKISGGILGYINL